MKRVLVTGATGFVGRALCELLVRQGYVVRAALRQQGGAPRGVSEQIVIGTIGPQTQWGEALKGVSLVMHLAARVHVLNDSSDHLNLYEETNVQGTRSLAEASAAAGVFRFVFLSSIKVNGESTHGVQYGIDLAPAPEDAYGISKWRAEQVLTEVSARTGMQTTSLRPPLVYGCGVRANFLRLLRWVDRGWPLPLGAIDNKRSLVSIWNLCDLLLLLLEHPAAAGRTWMVSDGEDVSTPELLSRLAAAMGRRARMWPMPVSLLKAAGALIGRSEEVTRICGSLAVDIKQTCAELEWTPPLSLDEGLKRTVSWYLAEMQRAR